MYPFGFQFNSASIFTYSNFPVQAFMRRGNISICSADFISLLLPAMEAALCQRMQDTCVIWLPTPNLWHFLKSIVFATKPVPSHCLLSPHSISSSLLHPLSLFLPCLHLYLSYCRTQKERASWTSFMPFRMCASACRMRWMKWPPMARG